MKFNIIGLVEKGLGEARKTGFPTLNISFKVSKGVILAVGVYAAEVRLDGQVYLAAACVGADWGADQVPKLEVYLFDAEANASWRSQAVEVILLKKIRDLIKFKDIDHARSNIARDVKKIKIFFQNR